MNESVASAVLDQCAQFRSGQETTSQKHVLPRYLEKHYWWAYLHPRAVAIFERQWIVNSILWGNFARLRDAALMEIGRPISGRTLQMACVYGDFTPRVADRLERGATLDVVDVAPIQLENLCRKVKGFPNVALHEQDASGLNFPGGHFEQVIVFFLLHELPSEVRKKAVREALRVVKPGGRVIFVDYHRPAWHHPLRYFMPLVFTMLEPFALDLWEQEIIDWVPADMRPRHACKSTYFGGLYQKVTMVR